jgi:hypothetical protein
MKHIWSILCQNSSIDKNTNLLSLFNCIEELSLGIEKDKVSKGKNLVIPITFQLISFWTIENPVQKNILDIQLEIFDPSGELLSTFKKNFDIAEKALRFRSIISINGIKITKEGRYIMKVLQKEDNEKKLKVVAELPLDVKIEYK